MIGGGNQPQNHETLRSTAAVTQKQIGPAWHAMSSTATPGATAHADESARCPVWMDMTGLGLSTFAKPSDIGTGSQHTIRSAYQDRRHPQ
jgi:hypothetical protein